jgi:hypothetical protein
VPVWEDGAATGARPGVPLLGPGAHAPPPAQERTAARAADGED